MASASGIVEADLALESAARSFAQAQAARRFNLDANASLASAYGLGSLSSSATVPIQAQASLAATARDLSLQLGLGQTFLSPTSGTATTLGASATATLWDGYSGGKADATLQKGEISLGAKRLDTSLARKTVRYKIRSAYFAAVGDLRLWQLAKESVATSGGQRKMMDAKFDAGYATKLDIQEAQATELSAIIDEKEAAAAYVATKQSLALLCGMDPRKDFEVTTELPQVAKDLDPSRLLAEGIANREDLASFALDLESNEIDAKLARALSVPTVAATGSLSLVNSWTKASASGASASLGISVDFSVVDSGSAAARSGEVDANRQLALAKRKATLASLELDIVQTLKTMDVLAERIALAERMLDIAKGKVTVARARYDEGLGSAYDLMTAISDQSAAASDIEQARIRLVQSWLQLENIIGR